MRIVLVAIVIALGACDGYTKASACERANHEMASRPRSPISPTPLDATGGMF